MLGRWKWLAREERGSVGPTVALALVGLIAAGGIAIDFVRLAALDTELQNFADQAAIAAATQLDGEDSARDRAEAAAKSLLENKTLFADGAQSIDDVEVSFYSAYSQDDDYDDTDDDTTTDATSDADAKIVRVRVNPRSVAYALTPIVDILSGNAAAEAVAGIQTAVCKAPPLMICNPNSATDPNFELDYAGKGFLLVGRNNDFETYGPGNFGFIDTGYDTGGGASSLRKALGQANFMQECSKSDLVTTEPGASSPALDAINTRFDIYSSNVQQNAICGTGQCPPAANTRKDLMRDVNGLGGGPGFTKGCKLTTDPTPDKTGGGAAKGWKLPDESASRKRYGGPTLPSANAPLTLAQRNQLYPMGLPRDICHSFDPANGCTTATGNPRLGTGTWDRAAYFQSNYGRASTGPGHRARCKCDTLPNLRLGAFEQGARSGRDQSIPEHPEPDRRRDSRDHELSAGLSDWRCCRSGRRSRSSKAHRGSRQLHRREYCCR
jgi:Flp pilus assembly protein TadG